jgi:hypothetical protein
VDGIGWTSLLTARSMFLLVKGFFPTTALQAGVPVVTKLGRSASSRAGGAIVKAIGLDDWVADDDDDDLRSR